MVDMADEFAHYQGARGARYKAQGSGAQGARERSRLERSDNPETMGVQGTGYKT